MKYSFLSRLAQAIYPLNFTCDICGTEIFGGNLCRDCLKTVTFNDAEVCPICGRKTARSEICMECKDRLPPFKKAVSPLVYEGGAINLIHKFKGGDGAYLKEYFADLICEKADKLPAPDYVIGVPMTKKDVKARGYNQSKLLAKSVALRLDKPFVKNAVIKIKETTGQKNLTRKEREKNLKGCFRVCGGVNLEGKSVLLIDDVMTTGATAGEICRILLEAKAREVNLATVCSVQYENKILPSATRKNL